MRLAQAAAWLGASLPRSGAGIWHWRDVSATIFIRFAAAIPRTWARPNTVATGTAARKINQLRPSGIEEAGQFPQDGLENQILRT